MNTCKNCNNEIPENSNFCPFCGASADQQPEQQAQNNNYSNPYQQPYNNGAYQYNPNQSNYFPPVPFGATQDTTGMLVLSILVTIMCCMPFGIVGIVYTVSAKSAMTPYDFQNKISKAKLFNIIGIASIAALILIYFLLIVVGFSRYGY